MTESPDCILVWVFLVLTIVLFVGGCVGCCHATSEGRGDKRPGGDDVEAPARGGADDLPPPPPKRWSPEERRALARAVSRLPPPCIREVRGIVGGDVKTAFFASLDVSVCDRVQQYVDAQPSHAGTSAGLSGLACICVAPAFYFFWFFAVRCAFH